MEDAVFVLRKMEDEINFDAVVIGAGVVGLAIANEICDIFDNISKTNT